MGQRLSSGLKNKKNLPKKKKYKKIDQYGEKKN